MIVSKQNSLSLFSDSSIKSIPDKKPANKEIPLQYHYNVGDTVYTSGHSLLFPPDIPLGIAGEARVVNGATNEIKVTLFQDFSAVRYVMVVHNDALDEIEGFQE